MADFRSKLTRLEQRFNRSNNNARTEANAFALALNDRDFRRQSAELAERIAIQHRDAGRHTLNAEE